MTSQETYAQRQESIKAQIAEITKKLKSHSKRAKSDPANWGMAGDLGYVMQQIAEINAFLGK
jgi:uncharacterized protein YqgV (UPF0045/DUF77 family)